MIKHQPLKVTPKGVLNVLNVLEKCGRTFSNPVYVLPFYSMSYVTMSSTAFGKARTLLSDSSVNMSSTAFGKAGTLLSNSSVNIHFSRKCNFACKFW